MFSSDAAKTFYPLFGFVEVGSVSLGEDNPKWQKKPVIVPLVSSPLAVRSLRLFKPFFKMVRKPRVLSLV